MPRKGAVPEIMASCSAGSLEDLKKLQTNGMFVYKLMRRGV
jgi:hypothetical protein